jgi:hypothetical protein
MEGIRKIDRSNWPDVLLVCFLDLSFAATTYLSALHMRDLGATWLFSMVPVITTTLFLVVSRIRSRLTWLFALSCFAVAAIRALGTWADETILVLPSLAGILAFMGLVTALPVLMAATVLKIPFWPNAVGEDSADDFLWLPIILRPLAMLALPLFFTVAVWGINWSHRSHSCFGITLTSMTTFACFVSLCYLAVPVLSIEKNVRIANLLPKGDDHREWRVLGLGSSIFYLWGLSIEWTTTRQYIVWTLQVLSLLLLVRIYLSLLSLQAIKDDSVFMQNRATIREAPWSRKTLALQVLWLALFSLGYINILDCMFQ